MTTSVYVNMGPQSQFLLSEGVCCKLQVIQYHRCDSWRSGTLQLIQVESKATVFKRMLNLFVYAHIPIVTASECFHPSMPVHLSAAEG